MLATTGPPPVGPGWAVEFKWDGVRALVEIRDGAVRLVSRNGNDVTAGYPELVAALPVDRDLVLDGEIVALAADGRPDFGLLQHRMHVRAPGAPLLAQVPVQLYLFDVLSVDGTPVVEEAYDARRERLTGLGIAGGRVSVTPSFTDVTPAQGLDVARDHRLEGIVAKRRTSRYLPGRRSESWVKTALFHAQEVVLAGWTAGRGNRGKTLGALLMGAYDGGTLRYLGNVGSGFSEAALTRLLAQLRPLVRADSPFDEEVPREYTRGVTWVEPRLVGEVEYRTLTHDGRLRHTVWRGLRPDRDPGEITVPGAAHPPEPPAGRKGSWAVGGREVALTNLDKELFPGITKRELVDYYARVSRHLLPYLAGRPVNLHRFPDGIDAPGFWQKELPAHAPDWVRTWENPDAEPGESRRYAVVDSTATLVWMANHAAVELHPWTSSAARPDEPDWALVDIDPGPDTDFDDVLVLARLHRTALAHLGVEGRPTVTGQRGVQIRIPVRPGYRFAETRGWVERLSKAVGRTVPELVSWEWHTDRRDGRIRLDYTQNARNRTLVAPFSPRPRPGAPVCVPIEWDELDDPALRPDRWTLHTVLERLESAGDPLRALIGHEQELPRL
ncbi:DNA ligase D [Pseudonocardia oroxyli]|uniref:DNA ligase (ATP) n=1 Tax=Pseudonocardia oroxyli TaxID=366584 RepID=A0A1G7X3J9_PSEOR|nr:DNA ligase D [Pseudonocardia oroxyli]SDG78736.1 bifunctional non-homologous end joining protein LigD [Pseudonocardia oroxyli]